MCESASMGLKLKFAPMEVMVKVLRGLTAEGGYDIFGETYNVATRLSDFEDEWDL